MGPVRLRLLRDARDTGAVGVNQPAAKEQVTIEYAVSANYLREMEVLVSVPQRTRNVDMGTSHRTRL